MRAPIPFVGVVVLAASVTMFGAAQAANGPTCQGKSATIAVEVPPEGRLVKGTDGDDVIVVTKGGDGSGLFEVYGLGGDDTICILGWLPPDGSAEADPSDVYGGEGNDSLQIIGSPRKDVVAVWDVEGLDVHLRGGVDKFDLDSTPGSGTVDAGPDGGRLSVSGTATVAVDLEDRTVSIDDTAQYEMTRFTRVVAVAKRVSIEGDRRANGLTAIGCALSVKGGRGDDVIKASMVRHRQCSKGARLLGQRGDDKLLGSPLGDVLLGGPGRDKAAGKDGRDRCQAEVRTNCER